MGLLDGKVVLVTGAGGGIGRAHALACAAAGARVVVNDLGGARDGSGAGSTMADAVVREIEEAGGEAMASHVSVTDSEACEDLVQESLERWGRLDAVVNNAGILRDRTFAKMGPEDWDAVVDVHLTGTRNVVHAALAALKVRGGSIINTTSYSGLVGNFGQSNYAAAKAGIYGFTRVLALELARSDITANCVAPVAKTRMTDELDMVADAWRPEQISPVVVFLASDLARHVTGRVFGVQGQRIHLYEVRTNAGVQKPGSEPWTATEIAERLEDISSWGVEAPALVALDDASTEPGPPTSHTDDTEAAPHGSRGWPIGRRYDGGFWLVDRAEIEAWVQATDDPNPAYRGVDAVAPPMYHARPFGSLMAQLARDPDLDLDLLRLVHGEHAMRWRRPLRHGEVLQLRGTLEAVRQDGSGRVVTFGLYGMVDGEMALEGTTTFFVRSEASGAPPPKASGERSAPTWTASQPTTDDQASRYAAASGDPEAVAVAGLCTMAFAQRDLVARACGGDPTRLAFLSVRFALPALPGDTLTLKVWDHGGGELAFVTEDGSGRPVITHGIAEILET